MLTHRKRDVTTIVFGEVVVTKDEITLLRRLQQQMGDGNRHGAVGKIAQRLRHALQRPEIRYVRERDRQGDPPTGDPEFPHQPILLEQAS